MCSWKTGNQCWESGQTSQLIGCGLSQRSLNTTCDVCRSSAEFREVRHLGEVNWARTAGLDNIPVLASPLREVNRVGLEVVM